MKDHEVLEPEVLPPESDESHSRRRPSPGPEARIPAAMIGALLDLLDVLTFGPLGLRGGLVAGFVAAFALFSMIRLPWRLRFPLSLAAGLYCAIPGTEFLPLGTLLGLFLKLKPPNPRSSS